MEFGYVCRKKKKLFKVQLFSFPLVVPLNTKHRASFLCLFSLFVCLSWNSKVYRVLESEGCFYHREIHCWRLWLKCSWIRHSTWTINKNQFDRLYSIHKYFRYVQIYRIYLFNEQKQNKNRFIFHGLHQWSQYFLFFFSIFFLFWFMFQ